MTRLFSTPDFRQLLHKYPEAVAAVSCAVLVILGWLSLNFASVGIALFLLTVAYVIGGYESTKEGLTTLFEEHQLDVDLLMMVAALGAASLGLWQQDYTLIIDGAILILIFAISGALESFAMQRTERNIRRLMAVAPDTARTLRKRQAQDLHPNLVSDSHSQETEFINNSSENFEEVEIPIHQLQVNDLIIVRPGELIPTDAIIIEGHSSLNQASITGESIPVEKSIGDEVFAGTLNGHGALRLRVHLPPESSLIQRVIRLVEQAQTEAPPSQQFIEKFERGYAQVIVISGILLAIIPPWFLGWNWETTIYRALIFLVVASPCALMAAIMPTLLSGIANGARQGILFKNGAQLEKIGTIKAIAFDKTGTLTTGKLQVVEILPTQDNSPEKVLQLAAALEAVSEHPIGEAIAAAASEKNLKLLTAKTVQAKAGLGIVGLVENQAVIVGKSSFVAAELSQDNQQLQAETTRLENEGKTVIWVAQSQEILGLIAVSDTVRSEAKSVIERLKKMGVKQIVMLTGDNQRTADTVAQSLGITGVYANLLPEDKLTVIRQLKQQYNSVAMIGDGINDAPALALATVGIAMGGAGTDVALETADIILMANRLDKLPEAIRLGYRSNRIVRQNIVFALSFIGLLLIANFAGQINLPLGVIGHEGSTVLVTLSGLRLLKA
ncbi:cadmium-translocating P-type ATPase [Lyngbya aestuarii BL J]|uniref:Cadmium-translocating P-type ATPase n=1 Tax=Lyngbya aestuarii BL J TaxID=1348334 RepID=U7QNN1_9CYAN|nr:heavy metal translocating P-type ATPase [Lyngbya aestuarii]ERT08735.1 cadmium-translocating P-type ATPase [Lyngbya aestuarii BL J]